MCVRANGFRVKIALPELDPDWDKRWADQIDGYFEIRTALLPLRRAGEEKLAGLLADKHKFDEAFKEAAAIRALAQAVPAKDKPGYDQEHAGRWQYQVELAGRSLVSQRAIRHVPTTPINLNAGGRFPQKCTLLGSFEQMGPDALSDSKRFWDGASHTQNGLSIDGVRIRPGEALCAVALVKRFAGPAFFTAELKSMTTKTTLRFPDTWSVAAAEWLHLAEEKGFKLGPKHVWPWNGQWLHWKSEQDDADEPRCETPVLGEIKQARDRVGKPATYYAILKLDGDDLGRWLRGEKSPNVRDVMHPDLVRYYESLGQATKAGLDAKRPVGPALHAAISTALANFALHVVPDVVEKHHGTVIYAGGDDTLVLLPASQALACALALRNAYTRDYYLKDGRQYLMMGSQPTLSGGPSGAGCMASPIGWRRRQRRRRRAEQHTRGRLDGCARPMPA